MNNNTTAYEDPEPFGLSHVDFGGAIGRSAFVITIVLLSAFCIASNAFVIYAVRCHPPLRKRNSNLWLSSLAATDIVVAILVMPGAAYLNVAGAWHLGKVGCKVRVTSL
jgi:hypothetical protein